LGETQAAHAPESSEHWKVDPLSLDVNAKLAAVEVVVSEGPEPIIVVGAVVSAGGGGTTGGVGAGGPEGLLARLRGSVPAATSAPSPNPSRSVSNLRGFVLVLCSSVQVLSPSRSGSTGSEAVFVGTAVFFVGTDRVFARFVTVTICAAFTLL